MGKIKAEDAAHVAADELEDMAREQAGILPLVGMPDVAEAVALAELVQDTQGLPLEVLAVEDLRAQVYRQQKVQALLESLIDLLKAHPELAGLSPAQRGTAMIDPKHDTARALRKFLREEIMVRIGALVRAEIARRSGKGA